MTTYTIERRNGDKQTATSKTAAINIARRMMGVARVYRGAEYQTDRPGVGDDREYCTGLDIWDNRMDATAQMGVQAPVVISWSGENMADKLPENVLARWDAADWDDETMTASAYRYKDLETGDPIELSESQAAMYTWGQCEDNATGGTQVGTLKNK